MLQNIKLSLASSVLVLSSVLSTSPASAESMNTLTGIDTLVTTLVTKSSVNGALAKNSDGYLMMDANGNFMFDYAGDVTSVKLNPRSGEVMALTDPIGRVEGQAAFPPQFANLAMDVYSWLVTTGGDPSKMPAIPAKIDWTCNGCKLVINGTTYTNIDKMAGMIPGAEQMGLEARAFTGLGPVEIGTLLNGTKGLSMSVRVGGCSGIVATSGPNAGKVGTLCMNGTFTFDLAGINLSNPMTSTLKGVGNSNCILVLHTPMKM